VRSSLNTTVAGGSLSPAAFTLAAYSAWLPSPMMSAPAPANEHDGGSTSKLVGAAGGSAVHLVWALFDAETVT
jgi:hypothetical protein